MTTLENFYFGNINPSEYKQSKDTEKKLSEMTRLLDELRSILTTEQQKEKLEQIEHCQLSLIALSEKDTYIEGFKLGVKMTTEIYADIHNEKEESSELRDIKGSVFGNAKSEINKELFGKLKVAHSCQDLSFHDQVLFSKSALLMAKHIA